MPAPVRKDDDRAPRWGYVAAIIVSALGHALIIFLLLIVLPGLFSAKPPPPSYTVKIADSLPAGNLGTHLPPLNPDAHAEHRQPAQPEAPHQEASTAITTPPPPPPDTDKNAIALNTPHSPTPKPPSTPTPLPTPEPTASPPRIPKPRTTPTPFPVKPERVRPTPQARPGRSKPARAPTPKLAKATPRPTPNIAQEIRRLHERLMAEHLNEVKKEAERNRENGGPVLASRETEGSGYGVGAGTGSAGVLENAEFLLYCQTIKKRIQDAWNFAGKNPKLTATVTVGINSDGSLNAVRVSDASRDPAFDDSVVRAIRLAAPFPPPPQKYRAQFADGVPVIFNLGALENTDEGGG